MPNKLSLFWQELKRRRVTRTITVYAAAAFVILELVDIISPNLGLPAWTFNLVLILLLVGFIITVIVSWIYDIHPDGGIVKTEPANKVKSEDMSKSSKSWKIASYISFVVIIGLIVLNVIPRNNREKVSEILDKSIAVLPFNNLSTDEENTYFIDGVMESILNNLCRIEDLRVPGRTSVMQYRENPKPIPLVAEEMDVTYVLEGSGQKIGNRLLLTVQLIIGNEDRHIWSKQYDRVIEKVEDLIDIQKEIAQQVAGEIKAIITPKEQELIEQIPTINLTAYDFYQRGREEHWNGNIDKAEELYHKALESDPAFAQAYNGLAQVYWNKHWREEYLSENFLDSVLILTDIALSYNPNLSETHAFRGYYYTAKDNPDQAILEFDKALQLNPNEWMAFMGKANLYSNRDYLLTIENLQQAINLNRGQGLSGLLYNLSLSYGIIGFNKQGKIHAQQYLDLTGDSARFYYLTSFSVPGHSEERIEILKKAYRLDSSYLEIIYQIGETYSFHGNHKESLQYFEKCLEIGGFGTSRYHRIGYAYWNIGEKEKANYYFNKQLEYSLGEINLGRKQAGVYFSYFDLAGTYAFRGEKNKAYEYLKMFNRKEKMPIWILDYFQTDPLFDSIRDEPEFQQIVRDVEAKYQAEHERVRQWLEENNSL